jgi:hypothetical protein
MLGARSQDIGPRMPDEIVVSVVDADRLFVVTAPANAKVKPRPTCMAVWRESERKAKQVLAAYTASNPKDQKLFDQYTRTQERCVSPVLCRECRPRPIVRDVDQAGASAG